MKKAFLTASVILSFAAALNAGEIGSLVTSHRCSDTNGKILWDAVSTTTPVKGESDTYTILEEGKGLHYGFKGETTFRSETKFTSDKGGIRPAWMKRTVFSASGKPLLEESQDYGPGNTVQCKVKDLMKGSEKGRLFKYKGSIINKQLTGVTIRAMLGAGEKQRIVNIVNDEPAIYSITIKVTGKEKITVNGLELDAFKVYIDPNIGLLSPAKAFIPKNYSWYSCEPPYKWLKFKGLETSISSPIVEITTLDN